MNTHTHTRIDSALHSKLVGIPMGLNFRVSQLLFIEDPIGRCTAKGYRICKKLLYVLCVRVLTVHLSWSSCSSAR